MKKLLLLLLLAGFALPASAQTSQTDTPKPIRKRFFNISYISDKIKLADSDLDLGALGDEIGDIASDDIQGIKNNWGVAITRGRTYALHAKPLARIITIGIDASFFDLSYSNYSIGWKGSQDDYFEDVSFEESKLHKLEYSLQVGPSVTITPGKEFTIAAYARFAPSFSAFYTDGSVGGNYMSMFVTGASATYRFIGVGLEARMGGCKYKNFSGDLDFSGMKVRTTGLRAYVQFRW